MANLYRKESCLHLGEWRFRRFNGRKDVRPCSSAFYRSERYQQQAGHERLLKRIRKFGS
jgi:hypothetical protein